MAALPHEKKAPAKYRPEFVNPLLLPAIEDFGLSNILSRVLPEESAAVATSLLKVNSNYQHDLKNEIRKALSIEQKIQFKNIHAAKLAQSISKQVQKRKKRLDRFLPTGPGPDNMETEVRRLLDLAAETSLALNSLTHRLGELDRRAGGKLDAARFPKLARLMETINHSSTGLSVISLDDIRGQAHAGNGEREGHSKHQEQDDHTEQATETDLELRYRRLKNGELNGELNGGVRNGALNGELNGHNGHNGNGPRDDMMDLAEDTFEPTLTAEKIVPDVSVVHDGVPNGVGALHTSRLVNDEDDAEMDEAAFELLVDSNIAKYRQKKEGKYQSFVHPRILRPKPNNPLKLLYSSSSLANSDMLKSIAAPEETDPLHSPFITTKSKSTVVETQLLSLHKKLRINALPVQSTKTCECAEESSANVLPASLEHDRKPTSNEEDDLWSSSGLQTETEEPESELLIWSSSDVGTDSSSDSADNASGATSDTDRYYLQLRHDLNKKRKRHRRRNKTKLVFRSESSPNPKHQPLHRTLKPKQSILKMAKTNEVKCPTPLPDRIIETPYRASPRVSFVSDVSAAGFIVQNTALVDEILASESEDGDLEDNVVGDEVLTTTSNEARDEARDESRAIDRLKSLLITS